MSQLNQQMTELLEELSQAITEKLFAVINDIPSGDRKTLKRLLLVYKVDSASYLDLLLNDGVNTELPTIVAIKVFITNVNEAAAEDLIMTVTSIGTFIQDKLGRQSLAATGQGDDTEDEGNN